RRSRSFRTSRIEVRSAPSPRPRRRKAPHTPLCSTCRCSRCACSPRRASSGARCRMGSAESKGPILPEPARLKRVGDALRAASKVFDTTGEVFFRSLTEHLNDVLHVDFVSIGELTDDGRHIRTVAVSAEGRNLENLEYELDHTPCQQAL